MKPKFELMNFIKDRVQMTTNFQDDYLNKYFNGVYYCVGQSEDDVFDETSIIYDDTLPSHIENDIKAYLQGKITNPNIIPTYIIDRKKQRDKSAKAKSKNNGNKRPWQAVTVSQFPQINTTTNNIPRVPILPSLNNMNLTPVNNVNFTNLHSKIQLPTLNNINTNTNTNNNNHLLHNTNTNTNNNNHLLHNTNTNTNN
eukprot:234541_1